MSDATAPSTVTARRTPLARLRALGDFVYERNLSAVVAGASLLTGYMLTDPEHPVLLLIGMAMMGLTALCGFARSRDYDGHAAIRRLRKAVEDKGVKGSDFYAKGLAFLSLEPGADAAAIRTASKRIMMANHADTGKAGLDMDAMITFRDEMLKIADRQNALLAKASEPVSPEALLAAYRRNAGPIGTAWGTVFPSKTLKGLGFGQGQP
jgi:hypothetical protein